MEINATWNFGINKKENIDLTFKLYSDLYFPFIFPCSKNM